MSNPIMEGLFIVILLFGLCYITIAETNIAEGKTAKQSSEIHEYSPASRAVDGNPSMVLSDNSCTHTSVEDSPWWQVDLETFYSIRKVTLVNTDDSCCKARLEGAIVSVGRQWTDPPTFTNHVQCGDAVLLNDAKNGSAIVRTCNADTVGRYVSVQLVGKTERLQLCEVLVFGDKATGCMVPSISNAVVKNGVGSTNLVLKPNDFVNSGSYINFECNAGYTRSGGRYNRCNGNRYENRHPTCYPSPCNLRSLQHGLIRKSRIQHGDYVFYDCQEGYDKITDELILCDAGTLVPMDHACVRSRCRIPTLPANMKAAQDYPDNKLNHGHKLSFTCESGYRLEKQQHTYIYCNEGSWPSSGIDNTCLPEPCSPPIDPTHGSFQLSRGTGYFQDSIITLECDEGYRISAESKECREGHWTTLPTCEITPGCPALTVPSNVTVTGGGTSFGDVRAFTCPQGYTTVNGVSVVTSVCGEDGQWTNQPPICSAPRCPALTSVPSNVRVTGRGTSYGSIRVFTCPEGFTTVNGISVVTSECGEGGQWSNQPPICSAPGCPALTVPSNVRVAGAGTSYGSVRAFMCPEGYNTVNGVSVVTSECGEDGQWTNQPPICSAPGCPALTVPSNVRVIGEGTSHGAIRAFKCSQGYTIDKEVVVTSECGQDGQWTNQPPICSDLNCGEGLGPFSRARVVGGDNAAPGAWPWMVGLYKYDKDHNPTFFCGGSLISYDMVLTAAHCFKGIDKEDIFVAAGSTERIEDRGRIQNLEEDLQILQVEEIIKHEQFDMQTLDYDIALLRLKSNVNITSMVNPVCLPESRFERNNDLLQVGENGPTYPYVTGWGYTKEYARDYSVDLKQSPMPLRNRTTCAASLEVAEDFTERMICAGFIEGEQTDTGELITSTGQKDACFGDSGGPLVRARDVGGKDIYYQIGIVSWGDRGCAQKDTFGFYTNVPLLVDWIHNKTAGIPENHV